MKSKVRDGGLCCGGLLRLFYLFSNGSGLKQRNSGKRKTPIFFFFYGRWKEIGEGKRGEMIASISHLANSGFVFSASCVACTALPWEINDSCCDLNEHCFPVLWREKKKTLPNPFTTIPSLLEFRLFSFNFGRWLYFSHRLRSLAPSVAKKIQVYLPRFHFKSLRGAQVRAAAFRKHSPHGRPRCLCD